jgi:hypothetical protein
LLSGSELRFHNIPSRLLREDFFVAWLQDFGDQACILLTDASWSTAYPLLSAAPVRRIGVRATILQGSATFFHPQQKPLARDSVKDFAAAELEMIPYKRSAGDVIRL